MKILTAISYGLRDVLRHWKLIFLVFIINMVFGIVAVTPIKSIITQSLSATHYPSLLTEEFDFVIWTDLLREHLSSIGISIQLLSILMGAYIVWTIFYIGGFTELVLNNRENRSSSSVFWTGGGHYFFRFLRLTSYILLSYLLLLTLLFWYMGINTIHVLEMESEMELMFKFKISGCILLLFIYLVSVFKELAKIAIARSDTSLITSSVLIAIKKTFSLKYLILGVILSLLLFLVGISYYLLSARLGLKPMFLSVLIIPQILLLFRVSLRYVRLSAYNHMSNTGLPLS